MPENTGFAIGDHFEAFIADEVATGRYRNASEVMRTAFWLLEYEKKKLEALRGAVDAGARLWSQQTWTV
jgi:antitoxin ParD1/3/4